MYLFTPFAVLDKGQYLLGVASDKAFSIVNHTSFLDILKLLGFNWVKMRMLLSELPPICLMEIKCCIKWSHLLRERERNQSKPKSNRWSKTF